MKIDSLIAVRSDVTGACSFDVFLVISTEL